MPSKIKQRSVTGLNNKSSSIAKLASASSPAIKKCVCKTCTCGQHMCQQKNKSGSTTSETNKLPLTGVSETKEQYKHLDIPERKLVKQVYNVLPKQNLESATESHSQFNNKPTPPRPQPHREKYVKSEVMLEGQSETKTQFVPRELSERHDFKPKYQAAPQRNIDGSTETSDQYIHHKTPPRPQPHVRKYEPNPAKFEGTSELHDAYKEWPSQGIPQKFKRAEFKPSGQLLEGESTSHADYKASENFARVQPTKAVSQYSPPTGPLETKSMYKDQYLPHLNVAPPQKHQNPRPVILKDDRDFTSVSHNAYQPFDASNIKPPVKRKQDYVPSPHKLEGDSVLHSDYGVHDLSLIKHRDLKQAALQDRQGSFPKNVGLIVDGTEYNDKYASTNIERVQPIRPVNNSNLPGAKSPLDGRSESSSAYMSPENVSPAGKGVYKMMESCKPIHAGKLGLEDRNFVTETKDGYQLEKLVTCPAALKSTCNKRIGQDGHLYFADSQDGLNTV